MPTDDRDNPIRRVEQLACRLFEVGLTPTESAELDRLLCETDDAARAYARYADLHAMLEFVHGKVQSPAPEARDIDREVFDEIIELAKQDRRRAEVATRAEVLLQAERKAFRQAARDAAKDRPQTPVNRVLVIPTWLVYAGGLATAALIALAIYPFIGNAPSPDPTQTAELEPTPQQVAPQPPVGQPEIGVIPEPAPAIPHATVARSHNAVWDGRQRIAVGSGLGEQVYRLTEGFVELAFANGASAIIQAPSELRITSGSQLQLDRGLLKATVPPGAEGFTVVTPAGRVVDLGTEFGVAVLDDGRTKLDVMVGRVRAELPGTNVSRELVAGQGTSLLTDSQAITLVPAQSAVYPATWSLINTGVRVFDDGVQLFSPPNSIELGRFESDNRIVGFFEQRGLTLAKDLVLSIHQPGYYESMPRTDRGRVSAGTVVDSYLLHFDAVGGPTDVVDANATFVFDRPILGLIVSQSGLAASDAALSADGVAYPPARTLTRGLEGREHNGLNGLLDIVQLSKDRKTLTIRMGTTQLIDQVRVILEAEPVLAADE